MKKRTWTLVELPDWEGPAIVRSGDIHARRAELEQEALPERRRRGASKLPGAVKALRELFSSKPPTSARKMTQGLVEQKTGQKCSLRTLDRALEKSMAA